VPAENRETSISDSSVRRDPQIPRRSARANTGKRPDYLSDYGTLALFVNNLGGDFALVVDCIGDDVPENYEELAHRPDRENWFRAVKEELDSLKENNTWTVVPQPDGRKLFDLDTGWVLKLKTDASGQIEKYKARLVAEGCSQRQGVDFNETYALWRD